MLTACLGKALLVVGWDDEGLLLALWSLVFAELDDAVAARVYDLEYGLLTVGGRSERTQLGLSWCDMHLGLAYGFLGDEFGSMRPMVPCFVDDTLPLEVLGEDEWKFPVQLLILVVPKTPGGEEAVAIGLPTGPVFGSWGGCREAGCVPCSWVASPVEGT